MIRPMLMGICEVNYWGQSREQIKVSSLSGQSVCAACWKADMLSCKTLLYLVYKFDAIIRRICQGRVKYEPPMAPSETEQPNSSSATCIFFFYYCNQLEDNTSHKHHCSFSEKWKQNKTTFIYFFCHGIGQR